MDWQPIDTAPEDIRVLVYVPRVPDKDRRVFEAFVDRDGHFYDPVYSEWDGPGATLWMPLPAPPAEDK